MSKKVHFGKKFFATAMTGAIVIAFGAPAGSTAAFADTVKAKSADGYVTAAASRAAQPAPEILGLSGVEETGNDWAKTAGARSWTSPKYYIMGDDAYNQNANPYMVNAVANYENGNSEASPTIVLNGSRSKGSMGPRAALAEYGTGETTDDEVWNMKPDVIVGTLTSGGSVNYSTDAYQGAVRQATGDSSYSPVGVDYTMTVNADMINAMYNIASAADKVVADSKGAKKLRYGNATAIAKNFEKYISGTQGYVLKQIANKKVSKKVVASVESYNAASKTFKLVKSGIAEGTASTNRYLEVVESITTNLADKLGKDTVTAAELAKADTILIGGLGAGSTGENMTKADDIVAQMNATLANKAYYVESSVSNGGAGSMYGVVMNSVENAQNIGRIIGFVYPTIVDQDDWVSYYYDNFYHIKSGKLAEVIDKAMDGVRNYDAKGSNKLEWTAADAKTYKKSAVQAKIDEGVGYLYSLGSKAPKTLKLTKNLTADAKGYAKKYASKPATTVTVNAATVSASSLAKQIKAAGGTKKSVTSVVLGSKVKTIKKNAFKGTSVKSIVVKTKKLTKKSVKGSLKSSKVATVKVNLGSAKQNKSYVTTYKKFFTKANAGKKVTIKA